MTYATSFSFDNSYARLPDRFFVRMPPTPVTAPKLVRLNTGLAEQLGLDPEALGSAEGLQVLSGNQVPEGAHPLAMAYAGHQFGGWVPQLGDGRAILLGEVIDRDGVRRDISLKGSGRTPFSRGGDGRAVLGPVLREYVVSEAMAALGVPTTRALAAVTTGEMVMREAPSLGAILTRIATSHVRVGTFEFFAARRDEEALRLLADYVIGRHYPEASDAKNPYLVLLGCVAARQAELLARWQLIGFIHRVMNTDNMSIAGETIDYGPCAFMDSYQAETVYSSIDHAGRYAYCNQPQIAHWNLSCLAQALLPLLGEDEGAAIDAAKQAIGSFSEQFDAAYLAGMRSKLVLTEKRDGDLALAQDLLRRMEEHKADFTLTFRGFVVCERWARMQTDRLNVSSKIRPRSKIGPSNGGGGWPMSTKPMPNGKQPWVPSIPPSYPAITWSRRRSTRPPKPAIFRNSRRFYRFSHRLMRINPNIRPIRSRPEMTKSYGRLSAALEDRLTGRKSVLVV